MRELHYGPGSITVGFETCTAVFDYALALASAGKSDIVTIPILAEGEISFSNILLNPSTQIFCTPSALPEADLDSEETLIQLRDKTHALTRPRTAVVDDAQRQQDFEFEY